MNPLKYPVPGPTGGKLIRTVIQTVKEAGLELPIASHILIGVSGGADSLALALLLVRYGRRVAAPSQITLIHVNHGWRGKVADREAQFVKKCAQKWGVSYQGFKVKPPQKGSGVSWENAARTQRKAIFAQQLARGGAQGEAKAGYLFTAHQAEDLAETVLWRVLTGSAGTHGGGIALRHGQEVRPFLKVRKKELQAFLKEEGLKWFEDPTNVEGDLLRAQMRRELFPVLEKIFPKAVERLGALGLEAQRKESALSRDENIKDDQSVGALFGAIGAMGLSLRQAHWRQLSRGLQGLHQKRKSQIDLPGGLRLTIEKLKTKK